MLHVIDFAAFHISVVVEEDWPESLQGVAKKAYDYYVKNLAPLGYKMRLEVLDFPGGMPGDIGIFFRW